jgi:hypothetical protein
MAKSLQQCHCLDPIKIAFPLPSSNGGAKFDLSDRQQHKPVVFPGGEPDHLIGSRLTDVEFRDSAGIWEIAGATVSAFRAGYY